ncbi:MAG: hypothetical protein JWP97_164 [Labilithrix sp.]|nr:hypothetical protein [Labilithrix sp.]
MACSMRPMDVRALATKLVPLLLLGQAGCSTSSLYAPAPPPPEKVAVRVFGDPGEPVEGAEVGTGAGVLGRTDAAGLARFALDGADGTRFDLVVRCPAGFGGETRSLKIVLRRSSRAPEYEASCKRDTRTALVAVRANGAAGAPVLHLGREVARVDGAGLALVNLDMKIGETFSLAIDTSDPRYKLLRPRSPEMSFSVSDGDELFAFEPQFHEERPVIKRAPAPKPHVPHRLD